jgi:hypothetical protein
MHLGSFTWDIFPNHLTFSLHISVSEVHFLQIRTSWILFLLLGGLRPFTLRVIIERYVLIPVFWYFSLLDNLCPFIFHLFFLVYWLNNVWLFLNSHSSIFFLLRLFWRRGLLSYLPEPASNFNPPDFSLPSW